MVAVLYFEFFTRVISIKEKKVSTIFTWNRSGSSSSSTDSNKIVVDLRKAFLEEGEL